MSNKQFKIDMMTAFNSSQAMGFIVNESDKYLSNDNLSTYKTMSRLMARKILSTTSNSIYCSKELMSPSLRAKITLMRYGQKAVKDYVNWYMKNEEWNPEARTHITKIQTDGEKYLLKDSYGEIDFNKKILSDIGEQDIE